MVKQKKEIQETTSQLEPIAIEEPTCEDNIRAILEEIKSCDGVVGYILRNTTSATIDLNDPTKVIDYAILSSSAFEASEQLSELLALGKVKSIIVDGRDAKTLHLTIGENNISIFMQKNADSKKILEKMHQP